MLVGTFVIALAFAAGVVGWRAVSGDDDQIRRDRPTWTAIAFVDRVTGDVTYVDAAGKVIATAPANGRAGSVHGTDGTLSLVNSQAVTVLPRVDADDEVALMAPMPRGGGVTPVPTSEGTFLALGSPTGGNVTLVDVARRRALDIGEITSATLTSTPLMFVETLRTNDDGSAFAIADATNFQTIVIRPEQTDPIFLPDQPIAIGEKLVATSQTVGLQADIALIDFDRSTKAAVPAEIPAGAVFDGDDLIMVSTAAGVFRIEPGADEAERIGTIAVPAGSSIEWARPTADGERLVVAGLTFEAIIDLDGTTVFSTVFTSDVEIVSPGPDWACLPIGGPGGAHSIIDLGTGEQLAELTGVSIVGVGDRGCAVLADRNGSYELITDTGSATLGRLADAHLGPDGRSVLQTTADGLTQLVVLDDAEGELVAGDPIDLTEFVAGNPLTTFITE